VRLFTGIAIDNDVMVRLEQAMRELKPLAPLNWSPLENLHITTKFIGAWPEERLEELTHALAEIATPGAFPLTVAGFGYLPRMLFAAVKAGPELAQLARGVEESVVPLGVAREQRQYTPHVTLARIGKKPIQALREHIAKMKNTEFGTFLVTEFHLYSSRPRRGGPGSVYEILSTFPLSAKA
jgi:2'-5' RNA ligase